MDRRYGRVSYRDQRMDPILRRFGGSSLAESLGASGVTAHHHVYRRLFHRIASHAVTISLTTAACVGGCVHSSVPANPPHARRWFCFIGGPCRRRSHLVATTTRSFLAPSDGTDRFGTRLCERHA